MVEITANEAQIGRIIEKYLSPTIVRYSVEYTPHNLSVGMITMDLRGGLLSWVMRGEEPCNFTFTKKDIIYKVMSPQGRFFSILQEIGSERVKSFQDGNDI